MGKVMQTVVPELVVALVVGACSSTVEHTARPQLDAGALPSSGGATSSGAGGRTAVGGAIGSGGGSGSGGRTGAGGVIGSGGLTEMGTGGEGPVCQPVVVRPESIIVFQDGGISTPLPCTWKIPPSPVGAYFDPSKVNVNFTPYGGSPVTFGYVTNEGDCAPNTWHYDSPVQPSQIILCPQTCDMVKASANSSIGVAFGCSTFMIH